jgi:hypothetical protein
MEEALKQSGAEIPKPGASGLSEACADLRTRADRWVVCFRSNSFRFCSYKKGWSSISP